MEFHISGAIRKRLHLDDLLFSFTGNVVFANVAASRKLAQSLEELSPNETADGQPAAEPIHAGALFAMGLIDELSHALVARYRKETAPEVLTEALNWLAAQLTPAQVDRLLLAFTEQFPNVGVFRGEVTASQWLAGKSEDLSNREAALEELLLLWLANHNPAFQPFKLLFADDPLRQETAYDKATAVLPEFFTAQPPLAPGLGSLLDVLRAPMLASPDSLTGQLEYIRETWSSLLGADLSRVLLAMDVLQEEQVGLWMRFHPPVPGRQRNADGSWSSEGFEGDEFTGFDSDSHEYVIGADGVRRRRRYAADYQAPLVEYEAFSADQAWMPTVVLLAKNTYVWLEQLSKKYGRHIHRLDQIPDEELQLLASRGMNGLWLIGLWERSKVSKTIKRLCGNADAVASAYSLQDYAIADDLGGEAAYRDLRERAGRTGLRLASDMVPNHMGIDSEWVIEHPEWFLSRSESPFPSYEFKGPNLSTDPRVEIKIEDHYYNQTDAAVTFRIRHHRDGETRYMYHGNDGTTFAWNDTAQLDYSKASVREHVMQVILDVARRFPIIRFDAAMVLAKRHVQRLWFPLPGAGGSIPSRAENALSQEDFDALMPHEFWREVVDRVAVEVPGTLLLAEAFWLLEGYFVRTLGMHRVYNSAFMNMLRDEENAKYRSYLKKTVEFDPDILKRYVNFMSNPDERTAADQFGTGDKYFGTSVLLATLPGLPMFGHGQVEGFTERYGMDFKQARVDEQPNDSLVARHQSLIAPLLKNRHIFAESTHFVFYDFWTGQGTVDENVFAYSNHSGGERAIVFYNNVYGSTQGTIHRSVGFLDKATGALQQKSLADGLDLPGDGSILAYRDHVTSLEHLRRASDLRDHGLTVHLHGYQHVVLLNWRVLESSATHPWDRLCDALGGAGVYSVDEALSQLRLRPLHEALRQTLTSESLHAFASLSRRTTAKHEGAAFAKDLLDAPAQPQGKRRASRRAQAASPLVAPSQTAPALDVSLDPGLQAFLNHARAFASVASNELGLAAAPQQASADKLPAMTAAAVLLPERVAALPRAFVQALGKMFPDAQDDVPAESRWAPVLAWLALRALSGQALFGQTLSTAHFDALLLRSALAEAFSSVGLKGEDAWRAAARIRILLKCDELDKSAAAVHSEAFWYDPDVRWLTGLHEHSGKLYFNREQFEEVLFWLQLPALLASALAEQPSLEAIEHSARAAAKAGYNLQTFLVLVRAEPPQEEADPVVEAVQTSAGQDRTSASDPIEVETVPLSRR